MRTRRAHAGVFLGALIAVSSACGPKEAAPPPLIVPPLTGVPVLAGDDDCAMLAPTVPACSGDGCPVSLDGLLSCRRPHVNFTLVAGPAGPALLVAFDPLTHVEEAGSRFEHTVLDKPGSLRQLTIAGGRVSVVDRVSYEGFALAEPFVAARAGDGIALARWIGTDLAYQGPDDAVTTIAPLGAQACAECLTEGIAFVDGSDGTQVAFHDQSLDAPSRAVHLATRTAGAWTIASLVSSVFPFIVGAARDAGGRAHVVTRLEDDTSGSTTVDVDEQGTSVSLGLDVSDAALATLTPSGAVAPWVAVEGGDPFTGTVFVLGRNAAGTYQRIGTLDLPRGASCACGGPCHYIDVGLNGAELVETDGHVWLVYAYLITDRDDLYGPESGGGCAILSTLADHSRRVFGVAEVTSDPPSVRGRWTTVADVIPLSVAGNGRSIAVAYEQQDSSLGYLEIDTGRLPP